MIAHPDIYSNIDNIVSKRYAALVHPNYNEYTFAIFDDNLSLNKLMITFDSKSDTIAVSERGRDANYEDYLLVTDDQNGTPVEQYTGINTRYSKVSQLLIDLSIVAPIVLLKCTRWDNDPKNNDSRKNECYKYVTIVDTNVAHYQDSILGKIQKLGILRNVDSWPSIVLRMITAKTTTGYVIQTDDFTYMLSWVESNKSIAFKLRGGDSYYFGRVSEFEDKFVRSLSQRVIKRISCISGPSNEEQITYHIPTKILDLDLLDSTKRLSQLFPYDPNVGKWKQILSHFFVYEPEDKLFLSLVKIDGVIVPLRLLYEPSTEDIDDDSKKWFIVPRSICSQKSTYQCLQMEIGHHANEAHIDFISGDGGCSVYKSESKGAGSLMLYLGTKIAQRLLQVKTVSLDDASTVPCPYDPEDVSLALVHMLKTGKTWYESKGYIPETDTYNALVEFVHRPGSLRKILDDIRLITKFNLEKDESYFMTMKPEPTNLDTISIALGLDNLNQKIRQLLFVILFFDCQSFFDSFHLIDYILKLDDDVDVDPSDWIVFFDVSNPDSHLFGQWKFYCDDIVDALAKPKNIYLLLLMQMSNDTSVEEVADLLRGYSDSELSTFQPLIDITSSNPQEYAGEFSTTTIKLVNANKDSNNISMLAFLILLYFELKSNGVDMIPTDVYAKLKEVKSQCASFISDNQSQLDILPSQADPNMTLAKYLSGLYTEDCGEFATIISFLEHEMGITWFSPFRHSIPSIKQFEDDKSRKRDRGSDDTVDDARKRIKVTM